MEDYFMRFSLIFKLKYFKVISVLGTCGSRVESHPARKERGQYSQVRKGKVLLVNFIGSRMPQHIPERCQKYLM